MNITEFVKPVTVMVSYGQAKSPGNQLSFSVILERRVNGFCDLYQKSTSNCIEHLPSFGEPEKQ